MSLALFRGAHPQGVPVFRNDGNVENDGNNWEWGNEGNNRNDWEFILAKHSKLKGMLGIMGNVGNNGNNRE